MQSPQDEKFEDLSWEMKEKCPVLSEALDVLGDYSRYQLVWFENDGSLNPTHRIGSEEWADKLEGLTEASLKDQHHDLCYKLVRAIELANFFFSYDTRREQKERYEAYFIDKTDHMDAHTLIRFNCEDVKKMQTRLTAARDAMLEHYPTQMQGAMNLRESQIMAEEAKAQRAADRERARRAKIAQEKSQIEAQQRAAAERKRAKDLAEMNHSNNEPEVGFFHTKPGARLVRQDLPKVLPFDFKVVK